jgi:hypothetical protein
MAFLISISAYLIIRRYITVIENYVVALIFLFLILMLTFLSLGHWEAADSLANVVLILFTALIIELFIKVFVSSKE